MPGSLDEIIIDIDCPRCGEQFIRDYGILRISPVVMCPCGARIHVDTSALPLAKLDALVDEANRYGAANDNLVG